MAGDLFLNLQHLIPVGHSDLKGDDQKSRYARGQISFMYDRFGPRLFKYLHNMTGGATQAGELLSRAAAVAVANATSGTTTSVVLAAAGWTPDAFIDRLLVVDDDAGAAGAAPEGEVGVIIDNTTDTILIDPARPFSAALAAGDDLTVYSLFDAKDAADGDLARDVFGVGMADLTDTFWGWVQCYGYCPDVRHAAGAVVAGDPLVAAAAAVGAFGVDGQELWVGWSPRGIAADSAQDKALAFLNVYSPAGPGAAP
jgi:hypothetical protein